MKANLCGALLLVVALLHVSCKPAVVGAPSEIGGNQKDLENPLVAATGIYPDGWMAASSSLQLTQPAGSAVLHLRAMVPQIADPGFHTTLELRIDDEPVALRKLGVGSFDISIPVADNPRPRRVALAFSPSEVLPGGDGRHIGARLESMGFEKQDPAKASAAPDVASDPRVHLGSGWGPLEFFGGETFRWVGGGAQVAVDLGAAHDALVTMMLEPGPSAGGHPLLIRVLDASGRQAGAVLLDQRRIVRLPLPLKVTGNNVFLLRAEGGGAKVPNESRILDFRVFAVDAEPID